MHANQSSHGSGSDRPLPVLRAIVDAVDHEILQLLERRNGLVGEIAQVKRSEGRAIRDFTRERELIADRRDHAAQLGLSPEVIESIYRLVLWASRDRQAALKAEVPPDIEQRTVAIIGGKGGMGSCMAQMFGELGHAVLIADLDTQLTPAEAARVADVVLISVPIDCTEDVIRELGPLVRTDGLIMDVTSVKTGPVHAMLDSTAAAVVGTHPLFGPSVHSLQGQRVVMTRGRGDEWFDWVYRMLHARGLNIVETTPETHDETMAIVQVLTHFATEVMGRALADLRVPLQQTLEFTSPIYLIELLMAARHFGQSSDLYAGIQMGNPVGGKVIAAFVDAARRLQETVSDADRTAFSRMFREVHDYFGEFTTEAMEKSSFLIDRIVERA